MASRKDEGAALYKVWSTRRQTRNSPLSRCRHLHVDLLAGTVRGGSGRVKMQTDNSPKLAEIVEKLALARDLLREHEERSAVEEIDDLIVRMAKNSTPTEN